MKWDKIKKVTVVEERFEIMQKSSLVKLLIDLT